MVIAFQFAQFAGQVIHLRFTEGKRFFELVTPRTVVAELRMQFIATNARTLFRSAVGTHANILQFTLQIVKQLFLGIVRAFQRSQNLIVLTQLRRMTTQGFTGTGTFSFRMFQALTQFFVQIAVAAEHFR